MIEEVDSQNRRLRLEEELRRITAVLKEKYNPQTIILFGSLATGQVHPGSDIDLLVVKETDKLGLARSLEVVDLCQNRVGLHVVVYTPKEFSRLQTRSNSFLRTEVLNKGKVLYRAA